MCPGSGSGKRGYAVESATARVCREAGGRVATNLLVRDLYFSVAVNDARRLEVVVDVLSLHGGAQLAVDTSLVSALHCDGTHQTRCSRPRRSCSHGSQAPQGADDLGTCPAWPPRQVGGAGWRGWRQVA